MMRTSRRWLSFALAATLAPIAVATARAQPDDAPPGPAAEGKTPGSDPGEHYLKMLDKRLRLDAGQKTKIRAVIDENKSKMEELHKKMRELQEQMKSLFRAQSEKIRAALTDDQKPDFDEINVRMREHMRGEGMGQHLRGGEGRWKRPGPPVEDDGDDDASDRPRGRMGGDDPRSMPPPEMWHKGGPPPRKPEGD